MVSEYTIKEALAELNISKATLYYRINKYRRKIEQHILMKNGKKFISRQGIEILRVNDGLDSLPESSDSELDCSDNSSGSPGNGSNYSESANQINNDAFNILNMENEFLKLQIREKDNQIQTLYRLVENSQLLLKHEQDKQTLLIDGGKTKKKGFWGIFTKS